MGLGRWLQERLPVAHVERGDGDSLLLDLLFDDLLNRRNDRSRGWQVRLGLVEPSLNSIRKGNLILRCSKGWEDNESLNESHDGASSHDACQQRSEEVLPREDIYIEIKRT